MKYIKYKICALIVLVVLLGVGYYFYKFSDHSISDGFWEPLYNIMQFLVASFAITFLMKDKIFRAWEFIGTSFLILILIDLLNTPTVCQTSFLQMACTRADSAIFFGFLFLILTGIFVIISLIWSVMDHFKNKKPTTSR